MDALYFRVSSDRQTAENQFEDLLQIAEKDGSGRDWSQIRRSCVPKLPANSPSNAYTSSKENPGGAAPDRGRYSNK